MSIGKSITMSATNMLTEALNITEFYGTTDGVVVNIRQRHKSYACTCITQNRYLSHKEYSDVHSFAAH